MASFFFPRSFSSPHAKLFQRLTLLALLRGHCIEGCPPLLNVLAFAVGADNPALLILRDCQDFREFFIAGPTEKTVLGHSSLPSALQPLDDVTLHRAENAQQFIFLFLTH